MNTPTENQQEQYPATKRLKQFAELLYNLFYKTRPPATPKEVHESLAKDGIKVSEEEISQWKEEREKLEKEVGDFFVMLQAEFCRLMPFVIKEQGRLMVIRFTLLEGRVTRVHICFCAKSTPLSGNVTPDLRPQPRRNDRGLAELVPPISSAVDCRLSGLKNVTGNFFLQYQVDWIYDTSHLRICEKGRQIGLSYADSYDSVRKVAPAEAKLPVWVMSRDELQAKQYLLYCKRWARALNYAAKDLGEMVVDRDRNLTALVLQFKNGLCIYSLSSNPDAIVGKTGHVKLDEFALHRDQRTLYAVAKPVTQWGGTLSIISTHRGIGTVFNEIITEIREKGNRMGWSLHTIPIQTAVEQGLVERINASNTRRGGGSSRPETPEEW